MAKKKVVSIEDRIPRLKQERKKKANRRLIFYLSVFFVLISIIVYLQSPLSHVNTIEVKGNSYTEDEQIKQQSGISENTNIWMINEQDVVEAISSNSIIQSVDVNRNLPWTIEIEVTEFRYVGYIKKDGNFFPVLGNGSVLTELKQQTTGGDAPIMINFSNEKYVEKMAGQLKKLPESILKLISEIHWKPTDDNKNKILLYMNDGYLVDGTMREFAKKMKAYPSIVSQIKPGTKGIVHIGVGAYFEKFNQAAGNTDKKKNNGNGSSE
ncbi:cell division protein FtsQ/DivIB [Virgibacillus ihumii]|uniref:cell division protein FtsQ/DivIB n=1 Tax=Virgibacillus ihumii TaxID=2686091 RepID=UPI00157CF646|nr:FtsQ-type POTRA domain-containing protein [Virgibacillus ihumii]